MIDLRRWIRAFGALALIAIMGILMLAAGPRTIPAGTAEGNQSAPADQAPAQTPEKTPEPAQENTPEQAAEATAEPTAESAATPEQTAEPTAEGTPGPTGDATAEPTAEPSLEPSPTPVSNELILKSKSRSRANLKLYDLTYLEGGMRIPALFQYDYDTVIATMGEREISVSTTGCGATSLSMAIAYLTENYKQTPYTLLYEAIKGGMYRGTGLSHGALSKLAHRHGLEAKWIWASREKVLGALNSGCPVIAHMGEGIFTGEGHYILLRGVAEDGSIYVTDPNSRENSEKTYSLSQIIKEAKTDDPFMILSLKKDPEATPLPDPEPTPTDLLLK